jgi:hypothetical protein
MRTPASAGEQNEQAFSSLNRTRLSRVQPFMTNLAGAAIVNAIGPIRQHVEWWACPFPQLPTGNDIKKVKRSLSFGPGFQHVCRSS